MGSEPLQPLLHSALAAIAALFYVLFSTVLASWIEAGRIFLRRLQEDLEERQDHRGAAMAGRVEQVRLTLQLGKLASLVVLVLLLVPLLLAPGAGWRGGLLFALFGLAALYLVDFLLVRAISALSPEAVLRRLLPFIRLFYYLFFPLAWLSAWMQERLGREGDGEDEPSAEDVQAYIDVGEEEGILEKKDSRLLRSIVDFGDTTVGEVMTPRTDVICAPETTTIAQLRDLVVREKHSRIPLFRENMDHVVGVANARDLLEAWQKGEEERPVSEILRPALFVPESKRIADLLGEFQGNRAQLAVVVDEYGGTSGLVTLEDVLEEIVGEIQDEYDQEEPLLVPGEDGSFTASAMLGLDEFQELFGVEVKGEEQKTLGGLVIAELGRVPRPGETLDYQGVSLQVLEAGPRRLHRLRLRRPRPPEGEP